MHLRRTASAGEDSLATAAEAEAAATQAAPIVQAEKYVLLEGIPQVCPLALTQQGSLCKDMQRLQRTVEQGTSCCSRGRGGSHAGSAHRAG